MWIKVIGGGGGFIAKVDLNFISGTAWAGCRVPGVEAQ